jgi:hypothetical protein
MIIKIPYIESYANVKVKEELFYHARDTLTNFDALSIRARNFLASLHQYEEDVPNTIRARLKCFEDAKDLASEIVRIVKEKEVKP